jgi:hypothetical protein
MHAVERTENNRIMQLKRIRSSIMSLSFDQMRLPFDQMKSGWNMDTMFRIQVIRKIYTGATI